MHVNIYEVGSGGFFTGRVNCIDSQFCPVGWTRLEPPELQSGKQAKIVDGEWILVEIFPAVDDFEQCKHRLFSDVMIKCQDLLHALASGYPLGEVSSWPAQVKEAEALQADTQAGAPLLAAIAAARGIPLPELASRVLAKSAAYAAASGAIIGRRQALEDAVGAAQTAEDLAAIDITAGWPA